MPQFTSDGLVAICKEYHSKLYKLEGDKWDLERGIKIRILEVDHRRHVAPSTEIETDLGRFG